MQGALARANVLGRSVMKTFVRNGHYHGGTPCEGMPFSIKNRYRLTWNYFWYTCTGIGAPFVILAFQMQKK